MDRTPYDFERCFVAYAANLAKTKKMSQTSVALQLFSDEEMTEDSKVVTWRQMRNTSKKGEPRKLTFREAVRLSQILGEDFASMCFKVQESLKQNECPYLAPPRDPPRRKAANLD